MSFSSFKKNYFSKETQGYLRKWVPLSALIGVVCGFAAFLFQYLLDITWSAFYGGGSPEWYLVILFPAMGGLIAGWIIVKTVPEAAGAGTDIVLDSIHNKGGELNSYSGPVKMVTSALTIGSGGSAGNEGPISQIGAGFSHVIGKWLRLKKEDMRIVLICGMSAGWSAVFRAPLGAALFAIEVPYRNDLESRAAVPALISSVVSFLVFAPLGGSEPIFSGVTVAYDIDPAMLGMIIALGMLVGLLGIVFVLFLSRVRSWFRSIAVGLPLSMCLGGLSVGLIGLVYPQVMGLGENIIEDVVIGSEFSLVMLLGLMVAKMAATSFTVGSGGSGGIFFPALLAGGCLGGVVSLGFGWEPYTLFVLVAMGAMMSAVSKTPIAAAVLLTEMTGGYNILVPLMIACSISFIISGKYSLYESQRPNRDLGIDICGLLNLKVKDVMVREVVALDVNMPKEMAVSLASEHPHYLYPVVDGERHVVGVMKRDVLLRDGGMINHNYDGHFESIAPEERAQDALDIMTEKQIGRLLVLDDSNIVIGILTRLDLIKTMERGTETHHQYMT